MYISGNIPANVGRVVRSRRLNKAMDFRTPMTATLNRRTILDGISTSPVLDGIRLSPILDGLGILPVAAVGAAISVVSSIFGGNAQKKAQDAAAKAALVKAFDDYQANIMGRVPGRVIGVSTMKDLIAAGILKGIWPGAKWTFSVDGIFVGCSSCKGAKLDDFLRAQIAANNTNPLVLADQWGAEAKRTWGIPWFTPANAVARQVVVDTIDARLAELKPGLPYYYAPPANAVPVRTVAAPVATVGPPTVRTPTAAPPSGVSVPVPQVIVTPATVAANANSPVVAAALSNANIPTVQAGLTADQIKTAVQQLTQSFLTSAAAQNLNPTQQVAAATQYATTALSNSGYDTSAPAAQSAIASDVLSTASKSGLDLPSWAIPAFLALGGIFLVTQMKKR